MPELPPVTTATLPCRPFMVCAPLCVTALQSPAAGGRYGSADDSSGGRPEPGALPATKLTAPRLRARVMARDRLVEQLVKGAHGGLTVVSAPAGWGKTTAVLEWRRRSGPARPFGWVTLDSDDSDPARVARRPRRRAGPQGRLALGCARARLGG